MITQLYSTLLKWTTIWYCIQSLLITFGKSTLASLLMYGTLAFGNQIHTQYCMYMYTSFHLGSRLSFITLVSFDRPIIIFDRISRMKLGIIVAVRVLHRNIFKMITDSPRRVMRVNGSLLESLSTSGRSLALFTVTLSDIFQHRVRVNSYSDARAQSDGDRRAQDPLDHTHMHQACGGRTHINFWLLHAFFFYKN